MPVTEESILSYGGGTVEVVMSDGSLAKRPVTDREQALWDAIGEILTEDTHGVWHRFHDEVLGAGEDNNARDTLVEAFAERYPEWVTFAGCDNNRFMTSTLVLVRHGTGDNHMGTSVVYLSQGDAHYTDFFLYPGHAESLLYSLVAAQPGLAELPPRPGFDAEAFVKEQRRKPSTFDAFFDHWRAKPWYAEQGHVERLEALATG